MADTTIEWTDKVWNPVTGCSKVSQGCKNCYAEGVANRFWGERKFTDVQCHEDGLSQPLHWKKPARIFVNSMSDLFHDAVPVAFITAVFDIMASCPQHTFQILTKRPERMLEMLCRDGQVEFEAAQYWPGDSAISVAMEMNRWPLPNVWLGVSVEDQKSADGRVPLLLQTPAAVRWISAEPLLGPVSLVWPHGYLSLNRMVFCHDKALPALDWVVVGGESGPGARPMHPDWARSLRDQCKSTDTPYFFKQWGEWLPAMQDGAPAGNQHLNASDEPVRIGKKAAGSLLDGVSHKEYPHAV